MAKVFVITGPSGVGKGTLIASLRARVAGLALSVSATTRRPRVGERDGVDYYFLTPEEFAQRSVANAFVESACYAGHQYGTLYSELDRHAKRGESVVLEIEVKGARQLRERLAGAVQIFIAPPSTNVLAERLRGRGTDDARQIEQRLMTAQAELAAQSEFAFVVVNDDLERASDELCAIVQSQT